MVTLDVKVQWGQTGLKISPPRLNTEVKAPDMILQKHDPDLRLHITRPQIENIDQRDCFREIGLQNFLDSATEQAQEAQAHVIAAIERVAQIGDRLGRIADRSVSVARVASEIPNEERDFNIDAVPKSRPKITFREGTIEGELVYGEVKTDLNLGTVHSNFQWGSVKSYMEKEPMILFQSRGIIFDQKV